MRRYEPIIGCYTFKFCYADGYVQKIRISELEIINFNIDTCLQSLEDFVEEMVIGKAEKDYLNRNKC